MNHKAKLFENGRSQAVRIPAIFRFTDCKEVFIRKDPKTGDLILSRRPDSWESFFALADAAQVPEGFMSKAERNNGPPQERDLF